MTKQMPDLSQFYGTENYFEFNSFSNLVCTDGIKYLADEVGCYWLLDIIASVQRRPKVMENQGFIIWRIVVDENSEAKVSGYTDCEEDGSYSTKKMVYSQKIEYTDFPVGEFEFYQQGNVLLLKGEY